jgi:hypothetical protein
VVGNISILTEYLEEENIEDEFVYQNLSF